MAAPSLYADMRNVKTEAARLDFARSMLVLLGAIPVAAGFVARMLWMAPAFLFASAAWGWRRADTAIKAHESARAGG